MTDAFDWARYEAEITSREVELDWARYESEFAGLDSSDEDTSPVLFKATGGCALIDDVDWSRYEAEFAGWDDPVDLGNKIIIIDGIFEGDLVDFDDDFVKFYSNMARSVAMLGAGSIGKSALIQRLANQFVDAEDLALGLSGSALIHLFVRGNALGLTPVAAEHLAMLVKATFAKAIHSLKRVKALARSQPYRPPPEPSEPPGRLVARTRRSPRGPNCVQAPMVLPARGKFATA